MKKIYLSALFLPLFVVNVAKAGNIYLSPSVTFSKIKTTYDNTSSAETVVLKNNTASNNNIGFSADLGYRGNFGNFFIGPELFYNYYNQNIDGFKNSNNTSLSNGNVKIKDAYGLALNFGYKFTSKFALYSRLGFGAANTEVQWYNLQNTALGNNEKHTDSIGLYSLGALYYLNDYAAFKLAYDRIDFRLDRSMLFDHIITNSRKASFNVGIDTLSVGMLFQF